MTKIVDLKGEWAAAIGKAFVAFGSIEAITVGCLSAIPIDRIQKSTKSFRLNQRIELLQELLEAHSGDAYSLLSKKLAVAKALAHKRNLIAHNPLALEFYQDQQGELSHTEIIASLHTDARMTLDELRAFADEAEKLAEDLAGAAIDVNRLLLAQRSKF